MAKKIEQLNLFGTMYEPYKITKPIRLIELFGGIGSQAKALERLNADFERYKLVEWAVPSIKAYASIHEGWRNERATGYSLEQLVALTDGISSDYNKPLTEEQRKKMGQDKLAEIVGAMQACHDMHPDISKIKGEDLEIERERESQHCYIMTYSFPCQDLSQAGKLAGMRKGTSTRSGLLWEVERLLKELKNLGQRPNILLMENVPQVHGERNQEDFWQWCESLEELGYRNYWQDLNSKNYGVPQNRLRTFMVSVLGDYGYEFPLGKPLTLKLRDLLEEEVDKKYIISEKMLKVLIRPKTETSSFDRRESFKGQMLCGDKQVSPTLTASFHKLNSNTPLCPLSFDRQASFKRNAMAYDGVAGTLFAKGNVDPQTTLAPVCLNPKGNNGKQPSLGDRIYDDEAISTCIATSPFFTGKIFVRNNTKKGYLEASEGDGIDCSSRMQSHRGTVQKEMCQTLKTQNEVATFLHGKVRRITPKESLRLMGFEDKDTQAMYDIGLSDSAIYHCAGDSIVVDVLMAIFRSLF